ncbi:MAG: cupin domain-containing protein [Gammaproteobacteria bacterium]|nr:cupin domain-containing protein [Gammaproteobacteria bacterium]MCP5458792.1 cupin domain-containing protein [Gammaproteobacteria bacterium]
MNVLGRLSPSQFLTEYWQKRPLLLRQAWPSFEDPFTPEELAGLACEEGVEGRLVLEREGVWKVRHGPFRETDFLDLPDSHWTLLVQDAEKQAPALDAILEPFRFVPDWRVDDLMISYAAPQGSVGPHVDNYDVFLLQGAGRRRWQIGDRPILAEEGVESGDLRLLKDFTADHEWILERGDLLYLPPRFAHFGVALEPCLTYSIGFRAPSHQALLSSYADFVLEEVDSQALYADPDLTEQDNPGRISEATLTTIKALLNGALHADEDNLGGWFGRFITEPKPAFAASAETDPWTDEELRQHLEQGGALERNPGSRFAYIERVGHSLLFIDGQEFALGSAIADLAPLLARQRVFAWPTLSTAFAEAAARDLILDLVNEGYLLIYEDD